MTRIALVSIVVLALLPPVWAAGPVSEYAGQHMREIKALSAQEIEGLLAGRGMGFGKPAELNRYPGPAHVLELADALELTGAQLTQTRAIHARMLAQAQQAGTRLVAAEAALEQLFQEGSINPGNLNEALADIAHWQAQVRGAHLLAHLEQQALLTPEQIERYVQLRGYAHDPAHHRAAE